MNSELFKFYAARAGLTLAKVAEALNIDVSTLSRKVHGVTEFTRPEIVAIRQILDLSVDESEELFFTQ